MSNTAYAIAWLNTKTMKVTNVSIHSESAMTLTRSSDEATNPLDIFHANGESYEEAKKWALREIKDGWMFKWAIPLLQE